MIQRENQKMVGVHSKKLERLDLSLTLRARNFGHAKLRCHAQIPSILSATIPLLFWSPAPFAKNLERLSFASTIAFIFWGYFKDQKPRFVRNSVCSQLLEGLFAILAECSQFCWGPFNRNSRGNPSLCWLGGGEVKGHKNCEQNFCEQTGVS